MKALLRPTSSRLAEGLVTHLSRTEVDLDLAERQWTHYCAALAEAGFEIVQAPRANEFPDSVFIEDIVMMFDGLAVLTSPGAQSRRGELSGVSATISGLGLEAASISLPGTLDGGDILKVGRKVYVGQSLRTNSEGIRQLHALVSARGFEVIRVPVSRVLHLKSAVTALPDGTVIGHMDDIDDLTAFPQFLAMPEHGAAAVVLSADSVLMSNSVPRSVSRVESLGFRVITVDISEFEKLEGCVTCLSVRIR